ncbi:hypothetical protein HMPREF0281_01965 [Corynebacterium ammoniagenes DSM 20306]|uniref:Uncharacterized protein n=1 Tax=Corynebacterium ammoniagenes DSM 20306 TaxID=649754 RepID=A0ABP2IAK9_CORAM|nr:hypothetical protein HMPREF0281_01965 [Corynebacterium ammoniagenes DSM 20306]
MLRRKKDYNGGEALSFSSQPSPRRKHNPLDGRREEAVDF